jgi:hypothetical protein
MVTLGAGLGLREGEAFGLTLPREEFLRRPVHMQEQAQAGQLAPLKTGASRRLIPADDWVLAAISAHIQRYGTGPITSSSLTRSARSLSGTHSATASGLRSPMLACYAAPGTTA